MNREKSKQNSKQAIFMNTVLGTLVYAVVLGFFNDYTDILWTRSYSITFAVAVIMQLLTYATFQLKNITVKQLRNINSRFSNFIIVFSIWLIMFLSKFVFLAVIDFIFGDLVAISGFVGLLLLILTMTTIKQLVDHIYNKLAD